MKRLVWLINIAVCGVAQGGIPEPDAVLYGTAKIGGVQVTQADPVAVIARVTGVAEPVGIYRFGEPPPSNCVGGTPSSDCNRNCIEDACDISCSAPGCSNIVGCGSSKDVYPSQSGDGLPDECPGDNYVLRIRLEHLLPGETQNSNAALIGQTAGIFLSYNDGPEIQVANVVIAQRGMLLNLNLDDSCSLGSSMPANCVIDPLQPHLPEMAATVQGHTGFSATFGFSCGVSGAVPGDFVVSCQPGGTGCPSISSTSLVGSLLTVAFNKVIPPGRWTCVSHTSTSAQLCMGSLPGDSNGDRTVGVLDVTELVDHLKGVRVPAFPLAQCDIDRSGICSATDLLREIDLLNGAGQFSVWTGASLPACPSSGP